MVTHEKRCVFCSMMLTAHQASSGYVCSSLACRWQITARPHEKRCAICGTLAGATELQNEVCSAYECQNSALLQRMAIAARAKAANDRTVAAQLRARATEYRDGCGERAGFPDAQSYITTVIPFNAAVEEPLADERRELFRARLVSVVADALSRRRNAHADDGPELPNPGRSASAPAQAVMLRACMLCRGNCCCQGGNHAFIGWNTILRYIDSTADQSPADQSTVTQSADELVALYMSHVGTNVLSDGCVYQGVTGCTLPRDMRSDTCNSFLCTGLHKFLDEVDDSAPPRAFVVPFRDHAFDHGMFATQDFVQIVRGQGVAIT